jgi:hypothetical protein
VDAPRFQSTDKKFIRPRATTATWLTPLAEVYVGGLYKITSPGGDKIYYGQVLDYNRADKRFKEHCANSDEKIQNTWHLEMVARHCVTGRPALERFEKALIQSHGDLDVQCINITYNATRGDAMEGIESRVEAARKDTRRATNLLQESVQVIEYSKKKKGRNGMRKKPQTGFRIQRRAAGVDKAFMFKEGGHTREEALAKATIWRDENFITCFEKKQKK